MTIPIYQVDAFTHKPFSGNPAAVCLLPSEQPDDWMQSLAREMNLSETAFLLPEADGYRLRWFTPAIEVDLCGHATLASAFVLAQRGGLPVGQTMKFFTRSGLLTAARRGKRIELNFPARPTCPGKAPSALLDALGLRQEDVLAAEDSNGRVLIEVNGENVVRQLKPDFSKLAAADTGQGVIVTSRSKEEKYDFISRFFAPYAGINEDPVTGSAHCCLAPYWAARLDKMIMSAYQASARGGELEVELAGERVLLRGHAVTIFRGELTA
ncbi:MAG: PhzF family phenazine biosynthesis protein [Anaerolineaceae bacterium]|nr:PhzF family phenazine biosynthesis protein [Anaerolineaceae bacterium]